MQPSRAESDKAMIPHGFILADLNNDGALDLAIPHSSHTYTILSSAAQQDLLLGITDGEARRTAISYDPAVYDAEWSTKCDWPARCDRSVGVVVSETVSSSGSLTASSTPHTFRREARQEFSYKRSRHGAFGRGALGFESRHITSFDGNGLLIGETELEYDNSNLRFRS